MVLLHRVLSDRFLSDRELHYNSGWISKGDLAGLGLWDSPDLIWGLSGEANGVRSHCGEFHLLHDRCDHPFN